MAFFFSLITETEVMEFMNEWWGISEALSPLQLSLRAVVMMSIALVLLRFSGIRPFRGDNAYDTVITFLIGGILSRGVVGATPFFSTIAGAISIMIFTKTVSKLSYFFPGIEKLTKGQKHLLYENGAFVRKNMMRVNITQEDLMEDLRLKLHHENLEAISKVYIEKNGELSFVVKQG